MELKSEQKWSVGHIVCFSWKWLYSIFLFRADRINPEGNTQLRWPFLITPELPQLRCNPTILCIMYSFSYQDPPPRSLFFHFFAWPCPRCKMWVFFFFKRFCFPTLVEIMHNKLTYTHFLNHVLNLDSTHFINRKCH